MRLASVGRDFLIFDNAELATVSGFGALRSITGDFTVEDNAKLSSCCGLLRIADNTVVLGGSFTLTNNIAQCNTKDQITTDCVSARTLAASPLTLSSHCRCRRYYFRSDGQSALGNHQKRHG